MGEDVTLVSSAEETAKDLYRELVRLGLEHPHSAAGSGQATRHRFAATGDPDHFQALARRFLGPEVESVRRLETIGAPRPRPRRSRRARRPPSGRAPSRRV